MRTRERIMAGGREDEMGRNQRGTQTVRDSPETNGGLLEWGVEWGRDRVAA